MEVILNLYKGIVLVLNVLALPVNVAIKLNIQQWIKPWLVILPSLIKSKNQF